MKMKWWQVILIIIVAGVIFYTAYPKYHFVAVGSILYRGNRITGRVESVKGKRPRRPIRDR